jgi:hypothetical protein
MNIWKLGCNWGHGMQYFDEFIRKEKIVLCWEHNFSIDDIVMIAKGHTIIALTRIIGQKMAITSIPEYEDECDEFGIDYEDGVHICKVDWIDLEKSDWFKYELQQGICQVRNSDVQNNAILLFEKYISLPIIRSVKKILSDKIIIPSYQRPYRWKADKHVRQLLEDIQRESQSKDSTEYRIGTLILHNYNSAMDIVDGQQRLVTISLILHILGYSEENPLLQQDFTHTDSKNNIKFNYSYIQNYLVPLSKEQKIAYKNFLLNNCTFVIISLNKLSEAFQLFDSQNARGKSLEPADLLKAFHLREMEYNTTNEKKKCVEKWEKAIDDRVLNSVLGDYLFRIRNWKRKEWNYYFTKEDIDEFKGISIIRSIKEGKLYPFISVAMQNSLSSNYQLDEPIVNGKRFFDYLDYYVQMNKELKEIISDKKFGLDFTYTGSYRTGDKRIKNLFHNILMCYYDKFGQDDNFGDFAKALYRWSYTTRLIQKQIRYETILNRIYKSDVNPIQLISSWYYPDIILFKRLVPKINISVEIKGSDLIQACIRKIEG